MVIGKIAIVNERFIHTDKRMGAGRMPHFPFGGITLMGDPDVRLEIIKFIVLDDLFSVTYYFQYEKITSMGKNEGVLFSIGVIKFPVDFITVLINELVFRLSSGNTDHIVFFDEIIQHFRLHFNKIPNHFRRTDVEAFNIPVILDMGNPFVKINMKIRFYELIFKACQRVFLQKGYLQDIIIRKNFLGNP